MHDLRHLSAEQCSVSVNKVTIEQHDLDLLCLLDCSVIRISRNAENLIVVFRSRLLEEPLCLLQALCNLQNNKPILAHDYGMSNCHLHPDSIDRSARMLCRTHVQPPRTVLSLAMTPHAPPGRRHPRNSPRTAATPRTRTPRVSVGRFSRMPGKALGRSPSGAHSA